MKAVRIITATAPLLLILLTLAPRQAGIADDPPRSDPQDNLVRTLREMPLLQPVPDAIGPAEIPGVVRLCEHSDPMVRIAAMKVLLERQQPADFAPVVVPHALDDSPVVSAWVRYELRQRGPDAKLAAAIAEDMQLYPDGVFEQLRVHRVQVYIPELLESVYLHKNATTAHRVAVLAALDDLGSTHEVTRRVLASAARDVDLMQLLKEAREKFSVGGTAAGRRVLPALAARARRVLNLEQRETGPLNERLPSADEVRRISALRDARIPGPEESRRPEKLARALALDHSPHVRSAAARELQRLGAKSRRVFPAVRDALGNETDLTVTLNILRALEQMAGDDENLSQQVARERDRLMAAELERLRRELDSLADEQEDLSRSVNDERRRDILEKLNGLGVRIPR